MALLWIEGFEGFGDTTGIAPQPTGIVARKYPVTLGEASMDVEVGRGGNGFCLEWEASSLYIQSPHLTIDATCVAGFAFQFAAPDADEILVLYDGITVGMTLFLNFDGTIQIKRGSTVLGTSALSLFTNTWYYIEFKVLTDNAAGTADLVVNGSNWLSLSGIDTQAGANAYHTAFRLKAHGELCKFDDLYFLDGTGSVNNDILGNRKVVAIDPDGAGDDSDWAPSAGSNYQNVDDGALLDEDTTYNETSTDAHQDLFTYEDLPANVASIDGIQITNEARITAGTMDLSAVIKTGATVDAGSPVTVASTSYVTTVRVVEEDPDTASAWTPSGVDGAQFGVRANT
jgi:hypothetical protein